MWYNIYKLFNNNIYILVAQKGDIKTMKHMTLDCYGANERPLDDVKFINEILNKLAYKLQIKPIEPPHLLPYYYGSVKEDIGVSGKMLLLGGHVTIHTFPLRTCYFVDIFYDGEFDEQEVIDFFNYELPYNQNTSNIEVRNRDILNGCTNIGPHKDNFSFYLNENNLSLYGSQGQLKMSILALKMAEIDVFKRVTGETPVLLLDDIFSELDIEKRNKLIKFLNDDVQTIMTTTDLSEIDDELVRIANIYKIENGQIIEKINNN